jgi:hypothetical protein
MRRFVCDMRASLCCMTFMCDMHSGSAKAAAHSDAHVSVSAPQQNAIATRAIVERLVSCERVLYSHA